MSLLATALGLGAAYAAVGAAVAIVAAATRTLHLAVGQVLVAGVLGWAVLASPAVGVAPVVAVAGALLVGAGVSGLLGPLLLARLPSGTPVLLGLVVAAGLLEVGVVRVLSARPVAVPPLLGLPAVGPLPGATVTALLLGVPLTLGAAWLLHRTRAGRAVRLVGASPDAAAAVGRDPLRVRTVAFAGAGVVAVVAGLLAAPLVTVGAPQAAGLTVRAVAAGVLFGTRRPAWALAAGLALGAAETVGGTLWPAAGAEVAVAALVVCVLVVRGDEGRRSWGRAW